MKVELHLLQNFPPANLNRDDTGTPKDCDFGGVRRARISSQCSKRSIRMHDAFERTLGNDIAIRTKRTARRIVEHLREHHDFDEERAQELAEAALNEIVEVDDDGETNVLYYAAPSELEDLAERLSDVDEQEDAQVSDAVDDFIDANEGYARTVDLALFGRMLADQPELNLEGACQVAHCISTNRVSMEFDFYTAVDDLKDDTETGAGMMGTTGYNSSCFYRYHLIDVDHLAKNLSKEEEATPKSTELAHTGVEAFIRAAVVAIPSGMQTSFAAQTPPQLVLAVVRPDGSMPMSLVNAFEAPAQPHGDTSLVADSINKLDRHWKALRDMYPDQQGYPYATVLNGAGTLDAFEKDEVVDSVPEVIGGVHATMKDLAEMKDSAKANAN